MDRKAVPLATKYPAVSRTQRGTVPIGNPETVTIQAAWQSTSCLLNTDGRWSTVGNFSVVYSQHCLNTFLPGSHRYRVSATIMEYPKGDGRTWKLSHVFFGWVSAVHLVALSSTYLTSHLPYNSPISSYSLSIRYLFENKVGKLKLNPFSHRSVCSAQAILSTCILWAGICLFLRSLSFFAMACFLKANDCWRRRCLMDGKGPREFLRTQALF